MTTPYNKTKIVNWSDIAANRHVKQSTYSDWAMNTRLLWLLENGLSLADMLDQGVGPIALEEYTRFLREVRLGAKISVTLAFVGLADDCARFNIRHEITADGQLAAIVETKAAWFDLETRRIVPASPQIAKAMTVAPRTADYIALPAR
jgi:acyl-CoA thioester hydrolase